MPRLVNQPTSETTRKVAAGALGAAASSIPGAVVVAMLARWFGLDVTPEEAIVIGSVAGSLVAALASWLAGYRTREEDTADDPGT